MNDKLLEEVAVLYGSASDYYRSSKTNKVRETFAEQIRQEIMLEEDRKFIEYCIKMAQPETPIDPKDIEDDFI